MRAHVLLAAVLLAPLASAQDHDPARPDDAERWELSGGLYYSDPPGSEDRVTPILYADRGPLHLEARYNYEDLQTLSVFGGWTFASEEEEGAPSAAVTPMLGAAFGETTGLIPALEFDVGWRALAWYAEMEQLFDLEDSDDSFFYSWSTLTWGFTDRFAAGLVVERSKLVDTDLSVQRGLALELRGARVGLSLYAYNLGSDDSYAVLALGFGP